MKREFELTVKDWSGFLCPKTGKKKKSKPKPLKRTPVKKYRSTPRRTKRIVDTELLQSIRGMPCLVTGCGKPSDPCHVTPRSQGGGDTRENVIPMCRQHHAMQHQLGWSEFVQRNPSVKSKLLELGRTDIFERAERKERKVEP